MSDTNLTAALTFRPARPEDRERMLEITARTWGDSGDYISQVWDRWLADPKGELTVAVLDDVVVALAKLTWQGEGQWWMEGLRVDPEQRLKGIGQAMNTYQVELAKKLGGGVIRYITGLRNTGSYRIAERAGFRSLARFVERVAEKLDGPAQVEVLASADLDAVWDRLRDSDLLRTTNGVCVGDWKAFDMTRERLAERLSQGLVMGVRDEKGRVCAWCLWYVEPDWDRLGITCLDGTTEGIITLAHAMRAQAAVHGKVMVEALIPSHPRVLDAVTAAGYRVEADPEHPEETLEHGVVVLELQLDEL